MSCLLVLAVDVLNRFRSTAIDVDTFFFSVFACRRGRVLVPSISCGFVDGFMIFNSVLSCVLPVVLSESRGSDA